MKYNYIISALVAATMVVGCSEETFLPENNFGKGEKMVVGAALDQSTRLAFSEEENGDVTLTWTADDYLSLIDPVNQQVTPFNLTNGEGTATGRFEGTPAQPYTNNQQVLALFSKNPDAPVTINKERNGVYIDLSGQDGTLNEKYQYMFGGTKYSEERDLNFSLSPLVSVIKATFTLPADVSEVSSIYFKDRNYSYRSNAFVMLQDGSYGENKYNAGDLIRLDGEFNKVLDEYGNYDFSNIKESDSTDDGILIDKTFIPDENGRVTAYFYLLKTKGLELQHDLSYNADDFIVYHYGDIYPEFYLSDQSGNQYIFRTDTYREINPGYVYDLSIDQPLDIINLPVEQEVYLNNNTIYSFIPTQTGVYQLSLPGENSWYDLTNYILGGNKPENKVFEAGKLYLFSLNFSDTLVIHCSERYQNVNLNEDFDFNSTNNNESNYYLFTPTETGLYSLDGMSEEFEMYDLSGDQYVYGPIYYLEKDKLYRFRDYNEEHRTTRVRWVKHNLEVITLTVGENTIPMPAPTAENENYGTFVLKPDKPNEYFKISGFGGGLSIKNVYSNYEYNYNSYIISTNLPIVIESSVWRMADDGDTYTYHVTVEKIDPIEIPINTNAQLQGGKSYIFTVPENGFYLYEGDENVIDLLMPNPIFFNYSSERHWLIANQNGSVRFSKKTVDGTIEVGEETTVKANKLYEIVGFGDSYYKPVLSESLEGCLYKINEWYGNQEFYSWNFGTWFGSDYKCYFIPRSDGKITIENVNY